MDIICKIPDEWKHKIEFKNRSSLVMRYSPSIPSKTNRRRLALAWVAALLAASPALAIVGGQTVPAGPSPMLMILSDRGSVCSGVVIAHDTILTAAHCVTGGSAYRLHWRGADGRPVMEAPKRITIHPDYHSDAIAARSRSIDLAIVQAGQVLPDSFTSAPLPPSGQPPSPKDARLTIQGFGLSSESQADSIGTLRQIALPVVTPYGQGKLLLWLAGQANQGACTGDSGGGIFDRDGVLQAITVWSEGKGQARCGAMTQGIMLAPHRAWIDKTLKR